jgi:16S rRNA (guanine527-N7)-methyltransferase
MTGRRKTARTGPRPARIHAQPVDRTEISGEELDRDFEAMVLDLSSQGMNLDPDCLQALREYGELVVERSRLLNLVAQSDRGRIFTRHIGECLVRPLVDHARRAARLADIGSGAGLPGIPLALASPGTEVVLIEPRLRKAQFLETAIMSLDLSARVSVFHGTAEACARQMGPSFDMAFARAVGRLPIIWSWALRLLEPGGWLGAFKGPSEAEDEVAAIEDLSPAAMETFPLVGRPRDAVFLQTPGLDSSRNVSRET